MEYISVKFKLPVEKQEHLIALLSDLPFEGFEEEEGSITAYIQKTNFIENDLKNVLESTHIFSSFPYAVKDLENKNWNEVWEASFEPVEIAGKLTIRASFHPKPSTQFDIVIDPRMAFGTGHHATTYLIIEWMLKTEFKNQSVLDWGSGSGILAILASKLGSRDLVALENDPVALETMKQNVIENEQINIRSYLDEKKTDLSRKFDIVLMNINKNTILDKINVIPGILNPEGKLVLSGFYRNDVAEIIAMAENIGLRPIESNAQDDWACIILKNSDQ